MASRETELRDDGAAQSHGQAPALQATARALAGAKAADTEAVSPPGAGSNWDGVPQGREAEAGDYSEERRSPSETGGGRMSAAMACVARFHEAFGLPRASRPGADIPAELAKLRVDLLVEETGEFADASAKNDIVGIADALADIVYVAYGAAVTYGIDLDAALHEVHRSNMSKLDEEGRPVYREDGKVLKSARYRPPDISGILSRQPPLPF
jgi:predicted HAD superfamily Cof-like phosphohydrolase